MSADLILVGVGPHAHYKHLPLIQKALRSGLARSWSVLELDSARHRLEELVRSLPVKPLRVEYVPDRRDQGLWYTSESDAALADLCAGLASPKVVLSTEPKAHFPYLKWCIAHGRDCLVDKPITIPMSEDRVMDPSRFTAELRELTGLARESPSRCSVMTPRRYHRAYETVRRYVGGWVRRFGVPVTYLSIYHGEGVWNTPAEYLEREDHPYKYGYGKLLHSGYHYVDLLARLLDLEDQEIDFAAKVARPGDQQEQMRGLYGLMEGAPSSVEPAGGHPFGETDLVASFATRRRGTGEVVTLGNLALLQTTTSLRNWWPLPTDVYNKTGRFGVEEIRLNLGFLASVSARILKVPVELEGRRIGCRDEMDITVWRNGNLVDRASLDRRSSRAADSYLEEGRWRLFRSWLLGEERKSRIEQHLRSVELLEKILLSVGNQDLTASKRP